MLSLGGPLLSPFSWFMGVVAWGVGWGTVRAGSFWMKQTLKLLKLGNCFSFQPLSLMQIGSGSGYCFYKKF